MNKMHETWGKLGQWVQLILIAPTVILTKLLIKLDPNHPFHLYDMSFKAWQRNGTEVFRFYAYTFDTAIVVIVIMLINYLLK